MKKKSQEQWKDTSCPRFLCCAPQIYTVEINSCVLFLQFPGYENCSLEFIAKLKMEADYTDKDNNLNVFTYGFLTYLDYLSPSYYPN